MYSLRGEFCVLIYEDFACSGRLASLLFVFRMNPHVIMLATFGRLVELLKAFQVCTRFRYAFVNSVWAQDRAVGGGAACRLHCSNPAQIN